jgi:hypothetical protein
MTTFEEAKRVISGAPTLRRFKGERQKFFVSVRGDLETQRFYRGWVRFLEGYHRRRLDPRLVCA